MKFINKIVAFLLIFTMVLNSKSIIALADSDINAQNNTLNSFTETEIETTETLIESTNESNEAVFESNDINYDTTKNDLENIDNDLIEPIEESIEFKETTLIDEEPEEDETTTEKSSLDENNKYNKVSDEITTSKKGLEESSINETTNIDTTNEEISYDQVTSSETQTKLFGNSDPKFRFAYFKEDMSIGLYTFDYVGFSVIPDSVSIAANELEALVYPDKRYNGAIDLGFENYNISWLTDNYTWDLDIYSDNPISLSDAYSSWCTSSTLEDRLYCANYAKLSEMTIVQNTIDTEYYIGENFNPTGLKVDVKFANNVTDTIEYTDSTKDHFKFYDNNIGDEYTTDTVINADFTLKISYGDVEHGSDAISIVNSTIDIIALDPSADKGFKVYCKKLDESIECINYVSGTSSEDFTASVRQFINGEEVASDMVAYQGCYFLNTYGGTDYEAYRTWNDTNVFGFENDFQNKVQEWIDGGKADNKAVGIILQKREYGNERGNLYIWHLDANGTIVKDTFTELVRMEDVDAFIQAVNNGIPSQYNSITGYYKDAYIDYQFYRPDRRQTEEFTGFRDLFISWKTNPGSFSFSDSRKICIAYERKIPDSISVSTPPNKVNYQSGEHFDPEGLVILATYPGNINDEIPCDQFRKYLFTFDPTSDADLTATNDKITITCCNKSVDLPIYVEPEVDSISICNNVKYDTYSVGEKLDARGLSITVNYVGAPSREIEYNSDTSSSFGFDPGLDHVFEVADIGVKSIALTYNGKQTAFNINVLENNKFVINYDVNGAIQSEILIASDSNIENALDSALQNGYAGFYNITATGFYDSKKKYNKTTVMTMNKNQTLELYNNFTGAGNIYIGAAVQAPNPTPTPTPQPPYNPGGGGGSSSGSASIGPMGDLTQNLLNQQPALLNEQLNSTNNIPQTNLIDNAMLAIILLSVHENEINPKINIIDSNGNKGFGKWLNVPGSNNWLFLAGDLVAKGTLGTAGFVSKGLYNLSWKEVSGWYSFDSLGIMQTGWQVIDGKRYYFEPNSNVESFGMAIVGNKSIDGKEYTFDANGVLIK